MKVTQSTNINWLGILGIVLLCVLSRLPQLMSPYLHPDEDECVLGLMAHHMALGQEFPFYFWGQNYGFSWIEAGAIALAIKFFNMGILSLKVPILLLWTTGCVFFYGALSQWTTRVYGFGATCLLIFSPAWMDWSMKARGGYITAFLLSSMALFLLARHWQSMNNKVCLGLGVLLGFIFLSQPVSLLGLLPLVVYAASKDKNFKNIFICIAGFIVVFIVGKVMAHLQANTDFWVPNWFRPDSFGVVVASFKERVFNALNQDSNSVSLRNNWAPIMVSNVWCVVLVVNLGIYIYRLVAGKASALSTLLLMSVLLILGCVFLMGAEYRYFLSFSVYLILWFGILSFEWMGRHPLFKAFLGIVIGGFIVLGICVTWDYKDFYRSGPASSSEIPEKQKMAQVIEYLKASGVNHVFSLDDDLGWKLLFYSQEQIISRWINETARQPMYSQLVDQAYLSGKPVAVVGDMLGETVAYMIVAQESRTEVIADQYFVHPNPSQELLMDKLRFQIKMSP